MSKILILLPSTDFDPSESAIPWKILSEAGHEITFGTPEGRKASADPIMLTGKSLGLLAPVLMADKNALSAYSQMENSKEFTNPKPYSELSVDDFNALIIPGGHAKGVRELLENESMQMLTSEFFDMNKIVGAVCHGVLLAARAKRADGKSVLFGRKTTGLLKRQENLAWNLTRLWKGDYYKTYPGITVEEEVKEVLESPNHFIQGPIPISRDTENNLSPGFCHVEGNYFSARWPGDCHNWALKIKEALA